MNNNQVLEFRERIYRELTGNILPFWLKHAPDTEKGGFWGRISNDLQPQKQAPKALILNTRILWTFSVAYQFFKKPEYLAMATRAYQYLTEHFLDRDFGGMYWLLDADGKPLETNKKIYGQAFTIYALSEYFAASGQQPALDLAVQIYHLVEKYSHDTEFKGYIEALNRDWSSAEDLRLSEVDMNEVKSMNTHLHVLEAYTRFLTVWPDRGLRINLIELADMFIRHILDPETYHFRLFFNQEWESKSSKISFGHDIEASWLLARAFETMGEPEMAAAWSPLADQIVQTTIADGFASDRGLYYERRDDRLDTDTHWWVQAEAIVGLINNYQATGKEYLFRTAVQAWDFIEKYLVDRANGEWFYKVNLDRVPDENMFKVSEWKCPYHNVRACLELMTRLDAILSAHKK